MRTYPTEAPEKRFFRKVEKTKKCWLWTASLAAGYGQFYDGTRSINAHRFSWVLHHGKIPDGLFVLHRCDNKNASARRTCS